MGIQEHQAYKIQLAAYNCSQETFNRILAYVPSRYLFIISREEMKDFEYGTGSCMKVFYNGSDQLIVPDRVLDHVLGDRNVFVPKKLAQHQVILYLKAGQEKPAEHTLTGMRADRRMRRLLAEAGYKPEETEERLGMFEKEYNPSRKQLHYIKTFSDGKIHKFENCAEFDINSAYCSVLIEIFPKAKELLEKAYEERKIHPENKAMFNYFVGMLTRRGHRKTYNYIVQAVTDRLNGFIDSHGGWNNVIYANTDGVIMKLVKGLEYKTSKVLGDFKLEAQGDCYVYRGSNYNVFQIDGKLKGSMLFRARKFTDLSRGLTVEYERQEHKKVSDIDKTKFARWFTAEHIQSIGKEIITEYEKSDKDIRTEVRKDGNENVFLRHKEVFLPEVQEFISRTDRQTGRRP